MARIRTIKPEFFRHELLQDLERDNGELKPMLVFSGLWTAADKNGVFEWKPRQLKLDILPFLGFQMEDTLQLLVKSDLIGYFEKDEKQYGFIKTFHDHQRITGKEATSPSRYPDPIRESTGKHPGNIRETSGKHPGAQEKEREVEVEKEAERGVGETNPPERKHLPVDNSKPQTTLPPFEEPEEKAKEALSERPKTEQKKPPHGNVHGERWTPKLGEQLESFMEEIRTKIKPYPYQQVFKFTQAYYNRANPEAMIKVLQSFRTETLKGNVIAKPHEWLEAALMGSAKTGKAGENGKAEAEESERIHEAIKAEEVRDVGRLVVGIGRAMQ